LTLERTDKEIIIRITENIDVNLLQDFIDYIKAKTILSKSKATKEDVELISKEINSSLFSKNKKLKDKLYK
jgi:hypothetical protein